MNIPRVSVVMPMRNAMPFLPAAIESILHQSFTAFELVIGDDESSDGSLACAMDYARRDRRIRILQSRSRLGPVGSSNWVANAAAGELVARMDADDICVPERLARQIALLDAHPDAVLVGSLFHLINADDQIVRGVDRHALADPRPTPLIAHNSILYRKAAFDAAGGYCTGTDYFEDVDLYARLSRIGDLLVIADPLVSYRFAGTSARLNDDRNAVEQRLTSMPAPLASTQKAVVITERPAPIAFHTFATLRLWSGQQPDSFIEMARRMGVRPLQQTLPIYLSALLSMVSPSLARQLARTRLTWRNWRTRALVKPGHSYRWRPHATPVDLGKTF